MLEISDGGCKQEFVDVVSLLQIQRGSPLQFRHILHQKDLSEYYNDLQPRGDDTYGQRSTISQK